MIDKIFSMVVEGLKITTPLVLGCIGLQIAYQQWRTAQHKLKLELFDRRYKIYQTARNFLDRASNWDVTNDELNRFRTDMEPAEFLFDKGMFEFFRELESIAIKLRNASERLGNMTFEKPEQPEDLALMKWVEEADESIAERFRPYLDLRSIR